MKLINLGGMSFAKLRREGYYYVDKTLLIADILDGDPRGVYLFTRPRRFGKTINLSMLDAFFNMEYKGNTWFDGLAISEHPEFEKYKNAFPVIHLDLGNTDADDFREFRGGLRRAVAEAFRPHRYLLEWPGLSDTMRDLFRIFGDEKASLSKDMLKFSVSNLSEALTEYHGVSPIILMDEYDRAVTNTFGEEPHGKIMSFLAKFMYASIKGNPNRGMVYVTGVMQIAKQTIFSGLNNIVVNNVFSKRSDERFGFTESEVKKALAEFGYKDKFDVAKEWYDGYRFGNAEVYNPYSIMYFIDQGCVEKAYWVDSGQDVLINYLLESITEEKYTEIMKLITGGTIKSDLMDAFPYDAIRKSGKPLYSLMVMSGYLKAVLTEETDVQGNTLYELSIPNEEVRKLVRKLINGVYPIEMDDFVRFNKAILEEDATSMEKSLIRILSAGSYLSLKENTYQAVVMTLVHALSNSYRVKVEAPEGLGRVDIFLSPKDRGNPYMIMELKVAKKKADLEARVDEAFKQIHDQKYYDGMEGRVILMGMSFWKKVPRIRIDSVMNGDGFSMSRSGQLHILQRLALERSRCGPRIPGREGPGADRRERVFRGCGPGGPGHQAEVGQSGIREGTNAISTADIETVRFGRSGSSGDCDRPNPSIGHCVRGVQFVLRNAE